MFHILVKISLNFIPNDPIDKESFLVQVMVWHPTGAEPLPEAILTHGPSQYLKLFWPN